MKIKRDNNANYNVTLSHIESNSKKLVAQLNTLNKVFRNYSKNDTDLLTITDSDLKKSLISKEVLLLGLDDDLALTLCKNDSIYKSILSDIKKIKSTKDYFYKVDYFKMIDFKSSNRWRYIYKFFGVIYNTHNYQYNNRGEHIYNHHFKKRSITI